MIYTRWRNIQTGIGYWAPYVRYDRVGNVRRDEFGTYYISDLYIADVQMAHGSGI